MIPTTEIEFENKNPHISKRWPAKLERKIDVFEDGKYVYSTCAYRTCGDAIKGRRYNLRLQPGEYPAVSARFSK